jgi:hypothetical protein
MACAVKATDGVPFLVGTTRRAGALQFVLTCGLAVGAAFAVLGLWQLVGALQQVSGILERQQPFRPVAPASNAENRAKLGLTDSPIVAISERDVRLDTARTMPPLRLEDPTPMPAVSARTHRPARLPECENMFVYIVSIAPRFPEQSAVSIAVGRGAPGRFRRIGQSIDEWEVAAIRDDWSGLNPEVWLSHEERLCRAELAGNPARVVPNPPRKKKRKRKVRRSR